MADKELQPIVEELWDIYEKLTELIKTDKNVPFVSIVAKLGKVTGDLYAYEKEKINN